MTPRDDHVYELFESCRGHLLGLALAVLGDADEAAAAVQESWRRAAGTESSDIDDLIGWFELIVRRTSASRQRTFPARKRVPIFLPADCVRTRTDLL